MQPSHQHGQHDHRLIKKQFADTSARRRPVRTDAQMLGAGSDIIAVVARG